MANFAMLPPEINSLLLFAGAGSAPMLDAAAALGELAWEIRMATSPFSSLTWELADQSEQGAASAAMLIAAAPYAEFLNAASADAAGVSGFRNTPGEGSLNCGASSGFFNTGAGSSGLSSLGRLVVQSAESVVAVQLPGSGLQPGLNQTPAGLRVEART
ncbi:PPE domain-containing protein [Mycobacterium spongiae]|uniref:PPE domain-containing protein n=1 Tax=Mycobacterium spongiae TaxID=886343 RepID=A0A975JZ64_9MYCO|nr:PPE domain-containing protein [Mycobacterium spongiae]QUR68406.1 PPE domain-containing protein [Mycobacterium spongiae]